MLFRAEELTPEQKSAIETLLGRQLSEREEFLLDTYVRPGRILPSTVTDEEREAARQGLRDYFAEIDARRAESGVSEEEEEEIILEALRSTRPNNRPID
jgi:hypothetical protein